MPQSVIFGFNLGLGFQGFRVCVHAEDLGLRDYIEIIFRSFLLTKGEFHYYASVKNPGAFSLFGDVR